ncbi:MAG: toprim domain-containing protein [Candidatus Binatia bacterium]
MYKGLSLADIKLASPRRGPGNTLRCYCPIHGGDRQRSMKVSLDNGHFKCFCCGEWGYLEEYREEWVRQKQQERQPGQAKSRTSKRLRRPRPLASPTNTKTKAGTTTGPAPDRLRLWQSSQGNLPGSAGEAYLKDRKISLEVARRYRVGFAPKGAWPSKKQERCLPRVVFPLTDPRGQLINLYGRAIQDKGPKHDILSGPKGFFNAEALQDSDTVYLVEGAFDALTLLQAGYPAVALIGTDGMRWNWCCPRRLALCLDADEPGQAKWKELAQEAVLRGKIIHYLPAEAYEDHKDLNEFWMKTGRLPLLELPPEHAPETEASEVPPPATATDTCKHCGGKFGQLPEFLNRELCLDCWVALGQPRNRKEGGKSHDKESADIPRLPKAG